MARMLLPLVPKKKTLRRISKTKVPRKNRPEELLKKDEAATTDLAKGKEKETLQAGTPSSPTTSAVGDTSSNEVGALKILSSSNISTPPHAVLLELVTRSENSKTPFDIATKLHDLYLSQTMNFVEAYHRSVGYHMGKTARIFMLEDVKVRRMSEDSKKWGRDIGTVLGRYLEVVGKVLEVVRGEGQEEGCWEVSHKVGGGGDSLEVREVKDGSLVGMKQEIRRFFS